MSSKNADGNDKDKVIEPTVHVYPVSKPQNQKSVLLCEAKGMVPDLVRFRWEAKDNNNNKDVPLKDDDQLEQRDQDSEVRITSILIVEESKATNSRFTCSVQHGTTGEKKHVIPTEEEIRKSKQIPSKTPTCPPKKAVAKAEMEEEEENMNIGVLKIDRSLYLFSMTYVILLVKNVLYFCTIFVLLFKRSLASTEFIKAR
ncbi:hypothetical protein C0J50_3173 [Silurus asotus]|uniref:Ig-like domain-containing protein n=1 Tax=Silurus asotus TaxID=30991 RepID=A0AAD5B5S7_SILAS|nr:hypothetical protein C0J50_3173 [Silurus asotus]